MRLMALDLGEKTIGTAFTDEEGRMAFPGTTLRRREGHRRDMAVLHALAEARGVGCIVVGLPLRMDDSRGVQVDKVEAFIARLRGYVRIPIVTQDERLSTFEAELAQIEDGLSREQRKETVDSLAACLILQAYLDRQRRE